MKFTWLVAAAVAAAGCAAAPERPAQDARAGAGRLECIARTAITGYQAVDDRHVVLFGFDERDAYVAEVAPGCFGLATSTTLGTVDVDANGQICGFGRDEIAWREYGRTESCRILTLKRRQPGT